MTDSNDITDIGVEARALVRASPVATLATTLPVEGDATGWPYASLALVATDFGGAPLLLISDLAEHTKNIVANARVSLLYDSIPDAPERLAGTRLTLLGRAVRTDDAAALARYLARHPEAEAYAAFADFGLYRIKVERAHLVAGFGKILWLEEDTLTVSTAGARRLADAETAILAHMNTDHAEAVQDYATRLLGLEPGPWVLTGCDPEGCDLRAEHRASRLTFNTPISSPEEARKALAALATDAKGG